jgi:hypothetical protein
MQGREQSLRFLEGMLKDATDPVMREKIEIKIRKLKNGGQDGNQ